MPWSGRSSRDFTDSLADHLVDGEVLADVAEEVDEAVGAQPLGVVEQQALGLARRGRQIEQAPELGPDPLEVGRELLEPTAAAARRTCRPGRRSGRCRHPREGSDGARPPAAGAG